MLISIPIHAKSQLELVIVISVPVRRLNAMTGKMKGVISKRGIVSPHFWGMDPRAFLADFTRKWCRGSTKSFDLLRRGSNPLFLGELGGL